MIDHLSDLKKAGVDSLKIEGRMKSVYYVALITRAYRKALDALEGKITQKEAEPFVSELYKVSHRPFGTGFYYGRSDADVTVSGATDSPYQLCAELGKPLCKEEENAVLKKGKFLRDSRKAAYDAMCQKAREAFEKRTAANPDKYLEGIEEREGWKMSRKR